MQLAVRGCLMQLVSRPPRLWPLTGVCSFDVWECSGGVASVWFVLGGHGRGAFSGCCSLLHWFCWGEDVKLPLLKWVPGGVVDHEQIIISLHMTFPSNTCATVQGLSKFSLTQELNQIGYTWIYLLCRVQLHIAITGGRCRWHVRLISNCLST